MVGLSGCISWVEAGKVWPMRAAILFLALVLVGTMLWLTMAWVPSDGSTHFWQAPTGTLTVPTQGLSYFPRWSHQRQAATPLETSIAAASIEGARVDVSVRWDPAPGTYQLSLTDELTTAFADRVEGRINATLRTVELRCLLVEQLVEEQQAASNGNQPANDCPANLAATLSQESATALGAQPERLEIRMTPDPTAVREQLLATIAEDLGPADRRVLVLGLDGLDWDLVLPWVQAGKMPHLDRLMKAGSWGVMETLVPILSPLIWTTTATGVSPDKHGILDFVEKEPTRGILLPVTGRNRRVPAVWNLASALERSVGVVGWWATWPAERVNGVMVSDRLYYTLTQGISESVFRQDPPELVFPEDRTADIVELRDRAVQETDWQAVRYFMDVPEQQFTAAVEQNLGMEDPVDGFRRILASSRTYLGAGLQLASDQPDLLMVYLEGTDTLGHLLAPYMPPPTLDIDPRLAAIYVKAVPKYFEVVDRWIGRFLEHYPLDKSAIVIVSDHGFKWDEGRPRGLSGTAGPTAPLWHETDAVFAVAGRGVASRGRVTGSSASVYDVAPTIMALLGLPADAGWPGTPLPGVTTPALDPIDYEPLVPPSSYRPQLSGDDIPVDPEFIAKLRSLGYLGGEEPGLAASSSAATSDETPTPEELPKSTSAPSSVDPGSVTRGQLNNLAVLKINQKEYDEAEPLLRQAIELSPEYPSPHYNLRRLYMETQRYEDADRELWLAVSKGLRDPERTVDRAAADYDGLELPERSAALLETAMERFPEHEPFWVHLLVVRIRLDQCAEALETGAEGSQKFPSSAPLHAFYGLAAGCVGEFGTARTALETSLSINPDQPKIRRTLSQLPPG